jgi:hypothetical protein
MDFPLPFALVGDRVHAYGDDPPGVPVHVTVDAVPESIVASVKAMPTGVPATTVSGEDEPHEVAPFTKVKTGISAASSP